MIIGMNSYFEHPSIAVLDRDEILFAVEDERFTGIKHGRAYSPYQTYLPVASLYHGLAAVDATVDDIDEIGYSYHRWTHLRSLAGCFTGKRVSGFREELTAFLSLVNLRQAMRSGYDIPRRYRDRIFPEKLARVPFREYHHHLAHAASAFHCSDFEEALVVVADGAGERSATSVYRGRGGQLERIGGVDLPNSLGIFYSMITAHLGFEPFSDEFKVMGLAAYGEPAHRQACSRILRLGPDGSYVLDLAALRSLDTLLGPARRPGEPLAQRHKDIARSVQDRLTEALHHVLGHWLGRTGLRNVCLAGGTFLNCVANGSLARDPRIEGIFVQPAAHDAGTAIGAAALSAVRRGGGPKVVFRSAALGTSHTAAACEKACAAAEVPHVRPAPEDMIDAVARRLADGEVVGVFRGRMEFGPRALGMRSLLASPADPAMRDRLNRIKGREDFRPVAPIVLREHFDTYFDGQPNRYMLFTTRALERTVREAPSAVHVDGTARVQCVQEDEDPWLHALITRFAELTGLPMVINTSLNVRGKPIVESPAEALACLGSTAMNLLVLEDVLAGPGAPDAVRQAVGSAGSGVAEGTA
ncbi:carbamoyltransferase [Streptomyces globisporus]|uniref:carbamoyltransferase family protein n=1 Tax=Streptomyces TaxID=1883 RepID=UPI00093D8604|nr:carbamoyltransferase C-terminal domain-containing protein [Streptomyces sp. TSRI0445]